MQVTGRHIFKQTTIAELQSTPTVSDTARYTRIPPRKQFKAIMSSLKSDGVTPDLTEQNGDVILTFSRDRKPHRKPRPYTPPKRTLPPLLTVDQCAKRLQDARRDHQGMLYNRFERGRSDWDAITPDHVRCWMSQRRQRKLIGRWIARDIAINGKSSSGRFAEKGGQVKSDYAGLANIIGHPQTRSKYSGKRQRKRYESPSGPTFYESIRQGLQHSRDYRFTPGHDPLTNTRDLAAIREAFSDIEYWSEMIRLARWNEWVKESELLQEAV